MSRRDTVITIILLVAVLVVLGFWMNYDPRVRETTVKYHYYQE